MILWIRLNNSKNTRVAVRDALIELTEEDKRHVLVCSDSSLVLKAGEFIDRFPDRYIDVGIAEQGAVNVAAGLASTGMVPFLVTYSGFITMRACEQVRSYVCYPNLNVKLVGANGGMASGEREGPSHQFFEDIGILRTFPRMTICVPSNARQVKDAVKAVARGFKHFTELVGYDMHITINWNNFADILVEENQPVISRYGTETPEAVTEELPANVPDFKRAYYEDGLSTEEFQDFGTVALFRSMFLDGWNGLKKAIDELKQ